MTDPIYDTSPKPIINNIKTSIGEIELVNGTLSEVHSPKYFSDWIMQYGRRKVRGLDVERTRLGHAYSTIQHDDGNFYLSPSLREETDDINPEWSRQGALSRIEWELSIPGMSEELQGRLKALHEMISNQKWTDSESRVNARTEYEKAIQDYVRRDEEAKTHIETYRSNAKKLMGKWKEFLEENGVIPKRTLI